MQRYRSTFVTCSLALALCVASEAGAQSMARVVFDGPIDSRSCEPFGCFTSGGRYQQAYRASIFGSAPVYIFDLSLFGDEQTLSGIDLGSYTFRLSTTLGGSPLLNSELDANVGGDVTTVYDGGLLGGPLGPGEGWRFGFSTPFLFDPRKGNLLLEVIASNKSGSKDWNLDAAFSDDVFSVSAPTGGGVGSLKPGFGLRTEFTVIARPTTVPEPASIALVATGLVVLVGSGALRRRPG